MNTTQQQAVNAQGANTAQNNANPVNGHDPMPDNSQPYVVDQQAQGQVDLFGSLETYGTPLWEATGITQALPDIPWTKDTKTWEDGTTSISLKFELPDGGTKYVPIKQKHESAQNYQLAQFKAIRDWEEMGIVTGQIAIMAVGI